MKTSRFLTAVSAFVALVLAASSLSATPHWNGGLMGSGDGGGWTIVPTSSYYGIFNLFVIDGANINGPIINPSGGINQPLSIGSHTYTVVGTSGSFSLAYTRTFYVYFDVLGSTPITWTSNGPASVSAIDPSNPIYRITLSNFNYQDPITGTPDRVAVNGVYSDNYRDTFCTFTITYALDEAAALAYISQLQQQLTTCEANETTFQNQITSLNTQIASLTSQLNAANAQNASLNSANANLTSQLNAANAQNASLTSANASLTSQLNAANAQIASLQSQLGTANSQIASLTSQLNAANSQIASLGAANANLTSQLNAANAQIASLTSANATLTSQLNAANAQIASLTAANATLTSQLNSTSAALAAAQSQITALSTQLGSALGVSGFTIPGSTPAEQLQNLATAISGLNHGQQQALYDKLTGKK